MKDFHFDAISAFENYEIEKMRDGHVVVTTKVVNSSLNYYGNAHGGYLFTLCDQISGLVVISLGLDGVTLQSSINYLKAGKLDDVLTIKGECVHIEKMRDGHVVVTTKVVNSSLNYYGNAHGGYLFTLCDQISGLVVISLGLDGVTLQSSINYLKAGKLDDVLTIKGECVHQGRTTCVMDVDITNQEGRNVCKATFTMFVTGQRSEERQVRI